MPTQEQVPTILEQVVERITAAHHPLEVTGHRLDDGWLTIVVEPTQPNIRASIYAEFMSEVERALRKAGYDEIVLVPALAA